MQSTSNKLASENAVTRKRAVEEICEDSEGLLSPNPAVVKALIQMLPDIADIRPLAEEALERWDPHWAKSKAARAAVPVLVARLRDTRSTHREGACWALGRIGDPRAVEPLVAVLQDTAAGVREAAAKGLGEIGDARAVEPLVGALEDDSFFFRYGVGEDIDKRVRYHAAEALGRMGDQRAVKPLVAALEDHSPLVREAAQQALKRLGPSAERALAERRRRPK